MNDRGRVLIVDDQPVNVKLLEAYLLTSGYEVFTACSGEEALLLVRETPPDIVLLDIMMPGLDGYEVTARLKEDPATAIIPVVLLTALEGTEDKVRGLDAGADDFLTKPVNRTELLARMRSMIKLKRLQEQVRLSAPPPAPPGEAPPRVPRKCVILLVEDDEKIVKHTRIVLTNAGYDTVVARSGREAQTALAAGVPDLILLDLMLPDANGLEVLAGIRGNPALAEVPVVITSALGDLETKVKGIDTGADDYLIKPVNPLEMLARINSNLRRHAARQKLKCDLDLAAAQAITDPLTGLYNRQHLAAALTRAQAACRRHRRTFSLLIIDLDHFKSVNDTYGHVAGDGVLKEFAALLKAALRAADIAARYGGEEFVALIHDTDVQGALVLAERFRTTVAAHPFPQVAGRQITVSIGVAAHRPGDDAVDATVKRADAALYRAKREGRNRVYPAD